MSKQQMIEAICKHNRSAEPNFLLTFDERQLYSYLRRLTCLIGHRGRASVWVREPETTGVVARVV